MLGPPPKSDDMNAVESDQDTAVLRQALPLQRRASTPVGNGDRCPEAPVQDEVAKVVRALDEARDFARALWVASPLDVKFTMVELRGGLPSWIPRP